MLGKIFKNSIIYGLAPQIPAMASVIALPFITPHLTETDFGIRGIIISYLGALIIFQSLGLRMVYSNAYFHYPKQYIWLWRQLLAFEWIWSFLFQAITALFLFLIIPSEVGPNKIIIIVLIITPYLLFGPIANLANLRYQLEENPMPISIRSVIFGVLGVALTYYFIAILKMGFMGWFWATFITTSLSNLSFVYPAFKVFKIYPIFNFKWRLIKRSLKVALPAIPHYYSNYLLDSSDRVVMDSLGVSTTDVGKYSMSYAIAGKFSIVGNALGLAVGPTYRKLLKEKNDLTFRKLTFILQGFFVLVTFLIAIWLKEIFTFLFRSHDVGLLVPMGIIILMAYNYRPMYLSTSIRLIYFEKTNNLWKISFGAGIINVILNFIFIPIYGFEAAAYTTFIALLYMGFSAFVFNDFKKLATLKFYPVFWILLIFSITVLALFIVKTPLIFKSSLTVLIFIILAVFYKKYSYLIKI